MGSFSFTCAVSGFPIQAGDPVRFFLLNQNPYTDTRPCSMGGYWIPRTFPIKAKYNDYGSVEGITDETSKAVWLKGFEKDLVENGWGDNSCHDVPCRKEQSFEELLEALWEQRVRVLRKAPDVYDWDRSPEEIAAKNKEFLETFRPKVDGIPRFRFVEDTIRNSGMSIYSGSFGSGGFEVNEKSFGVVRVRAHKTYTEKDEQVVQNLEKVQALFPEFASVIAADQDAGGHQEPSLTLLPKPFTKEYSGNYKDAESSIAVDYAMIREDVWQGLLGQNFKEYDYVSKKSVKSSLARYVNGITASITRFAELTKIDESLAAEESGNEQISALRKSFRAIRSRLLDYDNPGAWIVTKSEIPFSIGLAEHWLMLMQIRPPNEEEIRTAAEMAHVQQVLMNLRYTWRPSCSAGPQYGGWREQQKHMQILHKIAREHAKRERADGY